MLFAVQNSSTTWPELRGAHRIGVSVLAREHDLACRQLASKLKEARFEGISTHVNDNKALFIDSSALWLECIISSETPAGDHHRVQERHFEFLANLHLQNMMAIAQVVGVTLDELLPSPWPDLRAGGSASR